MTRQRPPEGAELFQLDRATCVALLTTQHVGRLIVGGQDVEVTPINYVAGAEVITFRTEPGGSVDRAGGRTVVFEVDMFDERTRSGWSVVVRGSLHRITDGDEPLLQTWAPGDRTRWMQVTVEHVTGRLLRGAVDADPDRRQGAGYL